MFAENILMVQKLSENTQIIWKMSTAVLTLFRIGGWGKKVPPTSFSPVTSTNVGFSPQNLLAFSFNPFATLVKISSSHLVSAPNYWTWTKITPQKSSFSGQILVKLKAMIIFLLEMLRLPDFGHMTTSII